MPEKLDSCVEQVMAQGHSESSAYAICTDALQGGSSPKAQWARSLMSQQIGAFPPKPEAKQEPPEQETEGIKLSQEQGTTIAQALLDVNEAITSGQVTPEVQQELEEAIAIMEEVANLEESPDAVPPAAKKGPPKPPM